MHEKVCSHLSAEWERVVRSVWLENLQLTSGFTFPIGSRPTLPVLWSRPEVIKWVS